jgi:phosphatidylglycerophosphate synthase
VALKFTKYRDLQPSVWGKASTFVQIMTAVAIMAARAYRIAVFAEIADVLVWGVAALAVISAANYTTRGLQYWRNSARACTSDNGRVV